MQTVADSGKLSASGDKEYNFHYFNWTSANWKKLIVDPFDHSKLAVSDEAAG